jgi:hypothetical protein
VIQRFPAIQRRFHEYAEVFLYMTLSDVFCQTLGPQRQLQQSVVGWLGISHADDFGSLTAHRVSRFSFTCGAVRRGFCAAFSWTD